MGFRRAPKRVIIQGNDTLARSHIGEADSLLNLCETQAGFQSLQQFQMVRNLEDGSRIIARMYAGLSDVIITSPFIPKDAPSVDYQPEELSLVTGFLFDASALSVATKQWFMWPDDYEEPTPKWNLAKDLGLSSFNVNHIADGKVLVSWKGQCARSLGLAIQNSSSGTVQNIYPEMFQFDPSGAAEYYRLTDSAISPAGRCYLQRFDNQLAVHFSNQILGHDEKICGAAMTKGGVIVCVTFDSEHAVLNVGNGLKSAGINSFWKRQEGEWELIGSWQPPEGVDRQHQCGWFFDDEGMEARCILVDRRDEEKHKNIVLKAVISEGMESVTVSEVDVPWPGYVSGAWKYHTDFTEASTSSGTYKPWQRSENSTNGIGSAVIAVDFSDGEWVYAHVLAEDKQETIYEKTVVKVPGPEKSTMSSTSVNAYRTEITHKKRTLVLPGGTSLDTFGDTKDLFQDRVVNETVTVESSSAPEGFPYPPERFDCVLVTKTRNGHRNNNTFTTGADSRENYIFRLYFMDLRFNELVYAYSLEDNVYAEDRTVSGAATQTVLWPKPEWEWWWGTSPYTYPVQEEYYANRYYLRYPADTVHPYPWFKSRQVVGKVLSTDDIFYQHVIEQAPHTEDTWTTGPHDSWTSTITGPGMLPAHWEVDISSNWDEETPYFEYLNMYSAGLPTSSAACVNEKTLACVAYPLIPGSNRDPQYNLFKHAFYFTDKDGESVLGDVDPLFQHKDRRKFHNIHLTTTEPKEVGGLEAHIFNEINSIRHEAGLSRLTRIASGPAYDICLEHAKYMAAAGEPSHDNVLDRLAVLEATYPTGLIMGENCHVHYPYDPQNAVDITIDSWRNSPGHWAIIHKPYYVFSVVAVHVSFKMESGTQVLDKFAAIQIFWSTENSGNFDYEIS